MHIRSHGLKTHFIFLLLCAACATDEVDPQKSAASAAASASAGANVGATTATPSADVSAAPVPISPTLGGSVLAVGQYQAELAVFVDGGMEALVFDAQATAVAPEIVNGFSAAFSVDGNAKAEAKLLWDAETKRFRGQHGLDAKLVGRPIDVTLVIGGKTQSGVLSVYTPLPRAKLEGSAQLHADAPSATVNAQSKLAGAKTRAAAKASPRAGAKATGAVTLDVPKPKLVVSTRSAAQEKSGASVKAKAKLGFGN